MTALNIVLLWSKCMKEVFDKNKAYKKYLKLHPKTKEELEKELEKEKANNEKKIKYETEIIFKKYLRAKRILEVLNLKRNYKMKLKDIGKKYKISYQAVQQILSRINF